MGKRLYETTHKIWYVSRTPDGDVWVETSSLDEFIKQNKRSKKPLKKYEYDSKIRHYDAKVTELA